MANFTHDRPYSEYSVPAPDGSRKNFIVQDGEVFLAAKAGQASLTTLPGFVKKNLAADQRVEQRKKGKL